MATTGLPIVLNPYPQPSPRAHPSPSPQSLPLYTPPVRHFLSHLVAIAEGKSHEACCLYWWEPARAPCRRRPRSVGVRDARGAGESRGADGCGGPAVAKTISAEESLDSGLGDRRDGRRTGSHLGRAPRRRLAADQREGTSARAVGELVLLCGAADPRIRCRRHPARELGSEDRQRLRLAARSGRHRRRRQR